MATLHAADGSATPYPVKASDVLWLSRAVQAEGPVQREVAAVLLNGFMWARARKGYKGTLTDWVRAYAQPINPRWYPNGDLFAGSYERADPATRETLKKRAQNRANVHSTRTQFTPGTEDAVRDALNGRVLSGELLAATDYAAGSLDATRKGYTLLQSQPGANYIWSRPGTDGWEGYRVDAVGALYSALPWLLGLGAVGLVVALVVTNRGA